MIIDILRTSSKVVLIIGKSMEYYLQSNGQTVTKRLEQVKVWAENFIKKKKDKSL